MSLLKPLSPRKPLRRLHSSPHHGGRAGRTRSDRDCHGVAHVAALLLPALLVTAGTAFAQYKVVGPDGRVTYTEAIEILKASGRQFEYPVSWGMDLQTEHERYLAEEHFKRPVFVSDYPKDIKAFYMRANEDGKTVAAMDLMVPGVGEMIGGSQREERYEQLLKRVREMGLAEEEYAWYLDLRRFGTAKHAGFGLGFERFVMYLTGITNIRDVLPFPRTVGHAEF